MGLTLELKVVPGSKKQTFTLDKSGIIKCFLKSHPEHGKANAELIKILSDQLNIQQAKIKIIKGTTARKKLLKIDSPLSLQQILTLCNIDSQTKIP